MARKKQTAKYYGKGTVTWTRFHLPANQEWPTWPCSNTSEPEELYAGPLVGLEGVDVYQISLGRMVEFPEDAVFTIVWRETNDLNNFLASPACDELLRNIPEREHGHKAAETESTRRRRGLLTLEDENPTSSPSAAASVSEMVLSRRRCRFLTLEYFESCPTPNIQGRVTLSAFVVPAAKTDDYSSESSLWMAYQRLGATFGDDDSLPCCDNEPIKRYWSRQRVWFHAGRASDEEEDMSDEWLERTFGRRRGANHVTPDLERQGQPQAQSQSGGPFGPKSLVCEFRVWDDEPRAEVKRDIEEEEANAKDSVFRQRWEQVTGEWMSRGRILAWKRERWGFRRMPEVCPVDCENKGGRGRILV